MALADRLAEHLAQPEHDEPTFNPTTEYDGTGGFIQTRGLAHAPADHTALLREFDYDPAEVKIVGLVKQTRWQQKERGHDPIWLTAYRFAIAPASTAGIAEVMAMVKRRRPVTVEPPAGKVFRFAAGDLQLGKIDGDGTVGTVDTYLESVDVALRAFKDLRRRNKIGLAHFAFVGDCGEGNQSQKGANMWRTELTVTEQYRLFRRLMLHTIDAFRPLVEVEVDVVNGNHDDVQRTIRTRPDDGHATEAAIGLADALKLNPAAYGGTRVFVPAPDEAYLTRQSGSSIVTMSHGHQWRRGKSWDWWAGQALNLQNPAAAQFLIHGHEHEFNIRSIRDRTVLCVPSFEAESSYWRQSHGTVGRRGAVILTTEGRHFDNLAIV